jgi:hypothetical protein
MRPSEVLLRVELPWTRRHEYVAEFKQSPRRDDDIAIVNAGAGQAQGSCLRWWTGGVAQAQGSCVQLQTSGGAQGSCLLLERVGLQDYGAWGAALTGMRAPAAGMRVLLEPGSDGHFVVKEASMAFGGVAAKTLMAPALAAALQVRAVLCLCGGGGFPAASGW